MRTVLVERHPIPGGMGTAALVNNFLSAHLDGKRLIIGGIFAELRQRLIERNAIYPSTDNATPMMEPYDPGVFVEEIHSLCREAGVELRLGFQSQAIDFAPHAVEIASSADRFTAGAVVDATGDAVVARQAGVPCQFGRASDGVVMPLTYCFRIGGIDLESLGEWKPEFVSTHQATGERYCSLGWHDEVTFKLQLARSLGELSIPSDRIPALIGIPGHPGQATVNFGRVECADPTDPRCLAVAEREGLNQVDEAIAFFRRHLPGFAHIELLEVARQIGVRQSWQIEGLYTLTGRDCVECRQFEDVIAQCCYALDYHEPGTDRFSLRLFDKGTHYDIPWRCLIPRTGPPQLVVAGRSISATWEAMSSFRVSPSVMAIGEAAGITAALAAQENTAARDVDWKQVQQQLLRNGGILK